MSKADLRLDWCDYKAAKYAVEHWHYSRTLPRGKNVYLGVWELGRFIGVIIFGTGASSSLGGPYGLGTFECCELVRVALDKHLCSVSRINSIALRMLKKQSPGLRLVVSFADPAHDHVGGIYQAGNWVFCGVSSASTQYEINGRLVHSRMFTSSAWWGGGAKRPDNAIPVKMPGKYRYLYPLDAAMRAQIAPLAKPYPKRGTGETDNAPGTNRETGGASPTVPLSEPELVE